MAGHAYRPDGTHFKPYSALTRTLNLALSNTEFTSVAADEGDSTFTFAGGDPVALGLAVGDRITFSDLSDNDNNATFTITGFGGTSNRVVSVTPEPDDMNADSSFSLTVDVSAFPASGMATLFRAIAFEEDPEAPTGTPVFYLVGDYANPTATTGVLLPKGVYEYIKVNPGERIFFSGEDGLVNVAIEGK